jgi:hypothetical protein
MAHIEAAVMAADARTDFGFLAFHHLGDPGPIG